MGNDKHKKKEVANSKKKQQLAIRLILVFLSGLLFTALIIIVISRAAGEKLTVQYFIDLHKNHQLMVIFDLIPFVLIFWTYSVYEKKRELRKHYYQIKLEHQKEIQQIISYINALHQNETLENDSEIVNIDESLKNSLEALRKNLVHSRKKEHERRHEEEKTNWITKGLANFAEILRKNNDNPQELTFQIISKLVKYSGAEQGGFFILKQNTDEKYFELAASFAYDRRKYLKKRVEWKEGLIGACAIEKEIMHLSEIPEDYVYITSGLGHTRPNNLLLIPLLSADSKVYGILEIAALHFFQDYQLDFFKKVSEDIANTMQNIENNQKTSRLLAESQKKSHQLAQQEEELRQNLEELHTTHEELEKKDILQQKEIDRLNAENQRKLNEVKQQEKMAEKQKVLLQSYLQAINNSMGTVEFNLHGIIQDTNPKYCQLSGMTAKELKGCRLDDFMDDKVKKSKGYREFWEKLRQGEICSGGHQYFFKGKEKWFYESFSPVKDEDGKIIKILALVNDITKVHQQEVELFAKTEELEAKNKELEKLSIVAEKTDNAIIIWTTTGYIEYMNEGYTKMTGFTFDEFVAEKGDNLFQASANPKIKEVIKESIEKKITVTYDFQTAKKNGDFIWVQTMLSPIFNDNNELQWIVTLDTDITEVKLAEEAIKQQKEEILAQRDELEQQRDTVKKQYNKIAEQQKQITDSIHYAERIQNAIMLTDEYIEDKLPEHFIYFKPRDIVSGDFYYINKKDNQYIFAAVDCTGHGIPGAFMSMIGIAFLNELITKAKELKAGELLDDLRDKVIESLHQTGRIGENQDGMDLALCIFNFNEMKLQYAGAHNPLYLIRNNELLQYKADKMPIGIYINRELPFTNHELNIRENDIFYIFSDGFVSQFGGKTGRTFRTKPFKKLLLQIHKKSMKEQRHILSETLEQWKGSFDQLDDILVMGIRV